MSIRNSLAALAFASATLLSAGSIAAAADEWPSSGDRITLTVPFDAGGSADRMARALANFLPSELNGIPVTVENRPGASGALGATWFTHQPDDGSQFLVMQASPYLINNIQVMDAPMKWEDFTFINNQWNDYALLMVHKDSPFKTVKELVEGIEAAPGKLSTGYVFASGSHISVLILLDKLGIPRESVRWVSYDGGNDARTAIAGGNVDFRISAAEGTEVIREFVRPLAIIKESADANWDAPPINEVLDADFGVQMPIVGGNIISVIARSSFKTNYPERYETFVAAYQRVLQRPDVQQYMKDNKIGAEWVGPEESAKQLNAEFDALKPYISLVKEKK